MEGDGAPVDEGSPSVELVDPGVEPRRVLRLDATVGSREEWFMTIANTVGRLDGEPVFGNAPPATYLLDLVLEAVEADARHYGFLLGSPPSAAGARVSARGALVVDDRGRPVDFSIEFFGPGPDGNPVPIDADLGLATQARSIAALPGRLVPLPAEAVGAGAEWVTSEAQIDGGVAIAITSHYELIALHPDRADIRVRIASQVDGDRVQVPELPESVKLHKLEIVGERSVSIASAHVLPRQQGSLTTELDMEQASGRVAIRTVESILVRPLEAAALTLFPPEAASLEAFVEPTIVFCKSLRGDREGRFPRESGVARLVGECAGGNAVGTWTALHDDGKTKRLEGQYDAGMPVGRWTQWSADGKELGSFALDRGTGTVIEWWPTGGKRLEVGFRGGKPHGALATWHANGKPDVRGRFSDGKRDGIWERLDAAGKTIDRATNDAGCRVVTHVAQGSAAERAGMHAGDIVTKVGATPIANGNEVSGLLAKNGDRRLAIVVMRNGKRIDLELVPVAGKLGILLVCGWRGVSVP